MTEPKSYKFNSDISIGEAIKSGFELSGNNLRYRTTLYKYDNSKQPYVELVLRVENMKDLVVTVVCNGGDIYIPFVNPEVRHDNEVYEKVVRSYHNIMDKLCKKKILKHVRARKSGKS